MKSTASRLAIAVALLAASGVALARPVARAPGAVRTPGTLAVKALAAPVIEAATEAGAEPVTVSAGKYEIVIYGYIGIDRDYWSDETIGVSAQTFLNELRQIPSDAELTVRVNSPGGDVFDGTAIHALLSQHKGKKTAVIDGVAASIASVIITACDEVVIPANAWIMIHDPLTGCWGNASDLRKAIDVLEGIKAGLVQAYVGFNDTLSGDEIAAAMEAETWYTGQAAVDAGFATRTSDVVEAAAFAGFGAQARFRNLPQALATVAPPEPADVVPEPVVAPVVDVVPAPEVVPPAAPALTIEALAASLAALTATIAAMSAPPVPAVVPAPEPAPVVVPPTVVAVVPGRDPANAEAMTRVYEAAAAHGFRPEIDRLVNLGADMAAINALAIERTVRAAVSISPTAKPGGDATPTTTDPVKLAAEQTAIWNQWPIKRRKA